MHNSITLPKRVFLMTTDDDRNTNSRMRLYFEWLVATDRDWLIPDLKAYATYLTERGLAPPSINSYLATIRSQYKGLLISNEFRDSVYRALPSDLPWADKKSVMDELERRIRIGISARTSKVKEIVVQDETDLKHIRLTTEQAQMLINAPGVDDLKGLRDTSMISMFLCTGIRVHEICSLNVSDLFHQLNGSPALLIRHGKGDKQRMIPYGDLEWCLTMIRFWLDRAGIMKGPVFRSFWKGNKSFRPGRITPRSVRRILKQYPISIHGQLRRVEPHDLRRSYARLMYEYGMDVFAIQQNLGHSNMSTTMGYIGALNADWRSPSSVYFYDLSELRSLA